MEFDEIRGQLRNYLNTRLNPYFGSVIIFWISLNKTLIYGLFNFPEHYSLEQKLDWIHFQLDRFSFLKIGGFWTTSIFAIVGGFFVMVVFNKINAWGKFAYIYINRSSINFLRKADEGEWISKSSYEKLEKMFIKAEQEVIRNRNGVQDLQGKLDISMNSNSVFKKELEASEKEKERNISKISTLNLKISEDKLQIENLLKRISDFENEKNDFRIESAFYGIGQKYIEVTSILKTAFEKNDPIAIENSVFKFDPNKYSVKELIVEYYFLNQKKKGQYLEGQIIEFKDGLIVNTDTQKSKNNKEILENLNRLALIFYGVWELGYAKDGVVKKEKIEITSSGYYYIDGEFTFKLLVKYINNSAFKLTKINTSGIIHSTETLQINSKTKITGTDSLGFALEYNKVIEK